MSQNLTFAKSLINRTQVCLFAAPAEVGQSPGLQRGREFVRGLPSSVRFVCGHSRTRYILVTQLRFLLMLRRVREISGFIRTASFRSRLPFREARFKILLVRPPTHGKQQDCLQPNRYYSFQGRSPKQKPAFQAAFLLFSLNTTFPKPPSPALRPYSPTHASPATCTRGLPRPLLQLRGPAWAQNLFMQHPSA